MTILFADVMSSTSLGERLDPERLQEVLAAYFGAMREEIEAEGGTVEKFIGDAVMAAFGVPTAHEDDPSRALRAALRMRERLAEVNAELDRRFGVTLQIRTGVNTGEVLAATNPRPGDPMVTGDAVNVAARLEQGADPGGIVVSERTARAARDFRFRELGKRGLRGKEQPVAAVLLEERKRDAPERGVPGLRAPMVGRDRELELLRQPLPALRRGGPAESGDDLRGPGRRQEPARRRVRRVGTGPRSGADDRAGAMPALRRRRDVLAARRDPERPREHPRHRSDRRRPRTHPDDRSRPDHDGRGGAPREGDGRARLQRRRGGSRHSPSDRWNPARSGSRSTPRGVRCSRRSRAGLQSSR